MTPPAPPAERLWLDYTTARPDLTGYVGVMRYLNIIATGTKGLTPAEITDLHGRGLPIGLIWETSADAALGGAATAVDHVARANAEADRLGAPDTAAIFYCIDFDATPAQVKDYVTTLLARLGRPVGLYGSYTITTWARTVGVRWTWQTYAWSRGATDPDANIYQRQNLASYDISLERHPFPVWGPS